MRNGKGGQPTLRDGQNLCRAHWIYEPNGLQLLGHSHLPVATEAEKQVGQTATVAAAVFLAILATWAFSETVSGLEYLVDTGHGWT